MSGGHCYAIYMSTKQSPALLHHIQLDVLFLAGFVEGGIRAVEFECFVEER